MGKIVLIDLDGTLTDTAHDIFKSRKDGQQATIVDEIPLFGGSIEFILKLKEKGHTPVIISDSHPKYVNPIAENLFKIPALSLADKPNSIKTKDFISSRFNISDYSSNCIVIGDTSLDIELGRSLNCPTILTYFYKASSIDERDGIGQEWKQFKSGPTYITDSYQKIIEIIEEPIKHLLAAEAIFHDVNSNRSRKFLTEISNEKMTLFRSLGRQNAGECDMFGIANKYFEFQRENRSEITVKQLAKAVDNFINFTIDYAPNTSWDLLTYVSDKKTTIPPNKISQLCDYLEAPIPKSKIFQWKDEVNGSIRDQEHFKERREFVLENIYVKSETKLNGKNVIVIDDQFTTGATAYSICNILRKNGVTNILFITLFYLITNVESDKICPNCQKRMVVKLRRSDGSKFFSCVLPKYGGNGCGYTFNIQQ